jgi:hypoxanthine phosphoribosyltransferase
VPGAAVLYTEEQIRERIASLADAITRDYRGRSPVLVTMLKGAVVFLADLFRLIDLPLRVDFMSITAYGADSEASGGVVRILKDLDQDIGGEDVIIVDDIIDTGLTLSYLMATLRARQPASMEVCALLDKTVRRILPVEIKYRGFDCPDRFVVGYGLDHEERYRNLPLIVAVDSQSALIEDPDLLVPLLGSSPEIWQRVEDRPAPSASPETTG